MPFIIRPISSAIATRIFSSFILPNAKRHWRFLEAQLASSGGPYLCGDKLTAADILMSFPVIASQNRLDEMGAWEGGSWKVEHPKVWEYVQRLEAEKGYLRSIEKVKEIEGTDKVEASL